GDALRGRGAGRHGDAPVEGSERRQGAGEGLRQRPGRIVERRRERDVERWGVLEASVSDRPHRDAAASLAPGRRSRYFRRRELPFFRGTLAPARRAFERPIAIACFRLFTFLRERPDLSVPRFSSRIVSRTFCDAFLPYFRAISAR